MRSLALVALADLRALQHAVRSGRLACPLRAIELQAEGLGHVRDAVLVALADLDARAVDTVLDIAIAERTERPAPHVDLVWTGPEAKQSRARDTAVVVRELFTRAARDVWIAGFRFDHGAQLLAPLHQAMAERGVQVRLFAHIQRGDHDDRPAAALIKSFHERFFRYEWPWPTPRPAGFHDPRTALPGAIHEGASLHAKCIVVDGEHTLIGSANFTDRAQTRNVEAGALISDRRFAARLIDQFHGLINAGHFLPL